LEYTHKRNQQPREVEEATLAEWLKQWSGGQKKDKNRNSLLRVTAKSMHEIIDLLDRAQLKWAPTDNQETADDREGSEGRTDADPCSEGQSRCGS